ncbi:MAG: hypothetical protein AAB263_17155 [Planctomycetota bacterium]
MQLPPADAHQRAEAERILNLYGGNPQGLAKALELLHSQFATMQARTQLLLTLATITMTITGFSGHQMAKSGFFASLAMAVGLICVLVSVLLMMASLRVHWLSQFDEGDPVATVAAIISYRDSKTCRYRIQITLLASGLACYVAAVVAYLIAP